MQVHPRRPDHPGPVTLLIQSVLGDGTCTKVPIIWNMKVWRDLLERPRFVLHTLVQ